MRPFAMLVLTIFTVAPLVAYAEARSDGQVQGQCIAVGPGTSRVAATVASPEDCCSGRMQCSQYLSTTVVVRPAREQRT